MTEAMLTGNLRARGPLHRGRQLSEAAFGFLLTSPLLVVLLGIVGYPLGYALTASFQHFRIMDPDNVYFVGFDNYRYVLMDGQFWVALKNTLLYAGIAVPVELALGLLIAMALNKMLRGARLVRTILLMPMMLAPIVMGLMWKFMFNDQLGIINHLVRLTGLDLRILWLADPQLAFVSLLIVEIWATTPIMVILLSAGLTTIPAELYEAAEIDGATRWQRFINITWPMLQPVILVSLLLRGMDAFRVFDIVFILTQGGPANTTDVLSYYAYRLNFQGMDVGAASAVSMLMLFVLAALGIVLIRRMRKATQ